MNSGNLNHSIVSTGAGSFHSEVPLHILKLRTMARQMEEVETMIIVREGGLKKKADDLEEKLRVVEGEKAKMEEESKKWKRECEVYKERLARAESDCKIMSKSEKVMIQELREAEYDSRVLSEKIAVSEKVMKERMEELSQLKEKVAKAENSAGLWQKKYLQYKPTVEKLSEAVAVILRQDPGMAKNVEKVVGKAGMEFCFNNMFAKPSVESTVRSGNGLKRGDEFIEIDDGEDEALSTGKRPINLDDGDARQQKMKRIKHLCFPNLSMANNSSGSSDYHIFTPYLNKLADKCKRAARAQSAKSKSLDFVQTKDKEIEFEADMRRAISEDDELCMSAVCAIYRQGQSFGPPYDVGGFNMSDTIRGESLAKFLIDGDPEARLRKSVKELLDHDPKGIDECRRLASIHAKQLFQLYQKEEDPYFCPAMIN